MADINSSKKTIQKSAAATINQAAGKWPTSFVARRDIKLFTGGLYSAGYLANCDSDGTGPAGSFKIGRQMCYSVESLCEWLVSRLEGGGDEK